MDIYNTYKRAAYKKRFDGKFFVWDWHGDSEKIRNELGEFFEKDRIFLTHSNLQEVINEVDCEEVDPELTVKVVVQKAHFNKSRLSIKSGVTTKLAFLLRDASDGETNWYLYGLASGQFNSRRLLNVTETNPLAYTVFVSISDREAGASGTLKTALERMRERISCKVYQPI